MGEMEHKKHSTEMKPYKRTHSRYIPRNETEEAIMKCEVQNYGGDFCTHLVPIHWRKKAFSHDTLSNTLMIESRVMVGPTLEAWACACAWRCMACIGSVLAQQCSGDAWRGSVLARECSGRACDFTVGSYLIGKIGVVQPPQPACHASTTRATYTLLQGI